VEPWALVLQSTVDGGVGQCVRVERGLEDNWHSGSGLLSSTKQRLSGARGTMGCGASIHGGWRRRSVCESREGVIGVCACPPPSPRHLSIEHGGFRR